MSSFGVIIFAILTMLFLGSGGAVASDDNPWRMDDTDQGDPSSFRLHKRGGQEGLKPAWEGGSIGSQNGAPGHRPGETIVPKTGAGGADHFPQERTWQVGPGKTARDEIFGYAGRQPEETGERQAPSRFGAFPPANGRFETTPSFRTIKPSQGGIQFGNKFYGAFPPLDDRASKRRRQQRPPGQNKYHRQMPPRVTFPNILPPPVPAPLPEYGIVTPAPGAAIPLGVPPFPGGGRGLNYQNPGLLGYPLSGPVR